METSSKASHDWTDEETGFMLTKLRELGINKDQDGNGHLFTRASCALSDAGFTRSAEQIRLRWERVKSAFNDIKSEKHQDSGHSQERCPHMEILHELLERHPTVKSEEHDYGSGTAAETSVNTTETAPSRQTSHFWTEEETGFMLAKLKELEIHKYMDGRKKRNGHLFRHASCALSEAGFTRSAEQIRERWKNVKTAYYNIQRQNQDSGNSQESCPHMEILHELLEECPTAQSEEQDVEAQSSTAAATSTNTTEMTSSNQTSHFWTDEETGFMLTKLKELEINKYMDGRKKRNGHLFKRVSCALSDAGFTRSAEQIRMRWKHVKKTYYNVQRQNQDSGYSQESCPHMEILHELLEERPTAQLEENIVETQSKPVAATSTNTTEMASSNQTSHFWTDEETGFMLTKLKELEINKYMDGRKKRNGHLFKRVSCALSDAGFTRSAEQIRMRWKHVKKMYYNVQRQNQDNGYSQESCPHMEILHELLEERSTAKSGMNNVDKQLRAAAATFTNTTEMASSSQTSHFWTDKETGFMLTKLKELEINKYMDGRKKRNGHLFKRVSCALSDAGFTRSAEQIRMRWKHVKRTYYNIKRQKQECGHSLESCPHMEILHELLEGRPFVKSERDVRAQSDTVADMLPLSSLCLLISPLRLMAATMWGIVQHKAVMHYGLLEDFITTVLDLIPELLTHSERDQLLLGLRTKVVLEMCRSEDLCFKQNIEPHLKIMYDLINEKEPFSSKMKSSVDNFSKVVHTLLNDPYERNMFYQNKFPSVFGLNFDSALCILVRKFLVNLEKLLPVPSLDQTSLWLGLSPSVLKECGNILNQQEPLSKLIQHHKNGYEFSPGQLVDDDLIFSSFCGQSDSEDETDAVTQLNRSYTEDDEKSVVTEDEVMLNESDADPQDCDTSIEFVYQRQSSNKKTFSCPVCEHSFVSLFEMKRHSISGCSADTVKEKTGSSVLEQEKERVEDVEAGSKHSHPSKRSGAEGGAPETQKQSWSSDMTEKQTCQKSYEKTCSECEQTFTSSTNLTNHTTAHIEDGSHICDQYDQDHNCKKNHAMDVDSSLEMSDGLKDIRDCAVVLEPMSDKEETLSNTNQFPCEECGQSFLAENFETHKLQCHFNSNVIESCHFSSLASVSKDETEAKLNQKSEETVDCAPTKQSAMKCTLCNETFSNLVHMRRHYIDLHNIKSSFQCPVCKRVFERLSDLVTHHQRKVLFQCVTCKRCFMSSSQLSNHRKNYNNDCTAQHICDICDKSYTDAAHLKKHKKSHKTETTTVCSYCGKNFCNKSSLQIHMNRHTGGFSCPICGKVFYQKTCLQRHIDRHNGQEPYLCEICGKRWATKAYLRLHMVQHSDERPFTCDQCGMTCKRESHLKEHIRSKHTEHRPFKCSHCNKAFKVSYILKQHMIRHTGVRPFVCSRCGKSYHKRHELKNHIEHLCP